MHDSKSSAAMNVMLFFTWISSASIAHSRIMDATKRENCELIWIIVEYIVQYIQSNNLTINNIRCWLNCINRSFLSSKSSPLTDRSWSFLWQPQLNRLKQYLFSRIQFFPSSNVYDTLSWFVQPWIVYVLVNIRRKKKRKLISCLNVVTWFELCYRELLRAA